MISPGDVDLFHYVESAEEAWTLLASASTASTTWKPETGESGPGRLMPATTAGSA